MSRAFFTSGVGAAEPEALKANLGGRLRWRNPCRDHGKYGLLPLLLQAEGVPPRETSLTPKAKRLVLAQTLARMVL